MVALFLRYKACVAIRTTLLYSVHPSECSTCGPPSSPDAQGQGCQARLPERLSSSTNWMNIVLCTLYMVNYTSYIICGADLLAGYTLYIVLHNHIQLNTLHPTQTHLHGSLQNC